MAARDVERTSLSSEPLWQRDRTPPAPAARVQANPKIHPAAIGLTASIIAAVVFTYWFRIEGSGIPQDDAIRASLYALGLLGIIMGGFIIAALWRIVRLLELQRGL